MHRREIEETRRIGLVFRLSFCFIRGSLGTDGSSGLRICTREPVRLTDVVETSYPGTQGWYGLQRIFPLEFFLGGLTGIADRFGLRRTTDESK